LVPLVLTSEISMPLDPVVFANCADEISKIGVDIYCSG
jgi:hypothetical protein